MTLEELNNSNYILPDGEILSILLDNKNELVAKITISVRQIIRKNTFRSCKLLLSLTQIINLEISDNANILGNYSDITLVRLDNKSYYISFDPYGNTNKPHENDNLIFVGGSLDVIEIE